MRYDHWHLQSATPPDEKSFSGSDLGPLVSCALRARGLDSPSACRDYLRGVFPHDPFLLRDMDAAVRRIEAALSQNENIAVYGDYDVDGMTGIAVLVRFLRSSGGQVSYYVPDRMEEGYGLNVDALRQLRGAGVGLVITVDAGVTAVEEAEAATAIGLDLIITDHHQCREKLPRAVAVVNPCREDDSYPFAHLSGVGVAFKLVCALAGADRLEEMLDMYGDLVALGTVADVMPLADENRFIVRRALTRLRDTKSAGLRALLLETDLLDKRATAVTFSHQLAPRINAAGRLGRTETSVELLLTDDPRRASLLAQELTALNRNRQSLENDITQQALAMLEEATDYPVIVLAREGWHVGVVGIVASRLAERFRKPVFLICLEQGVGKGSARDYGGVNLADALACAADLLTTFGGHDKAAGFSLPEANIPAFSERMSEYVAKLSSDVKKRVLEVDAAPPAMLFTHGNVLELQQMEPFGVSNPQPVFLLRGVYIHHVTPVGGGRHLKLTVSAGEHTFAGIFFGVEASALDFCEQDRADIAFCAEINTFARKSRVQFNLCDIRLSNPERDLENASLSLYESFTADSGYTLPPDQRRVLTPGREQLAAIWRYLRRQAVSGALTARLPLLSRNIARDAGLPLSPGQLAVALDVLEELGLLTRATTDGVTTITPAVNPAKANLASSGILGRLTSAGGE